ncbi:hypothetical protein E6Q11_00880 [Candidatus Dojkabacteria bacterium]|uniref:Uncharacterized protein n=1 Tax=Candidatus Dojkabacteria bacterium TaxID=2099670 RepID=A0A5C7JBC2_9BACT|nr:MAG: hypothetical protein E6Q11_00880 [Candidatus Dojkabacteria bacterium]
MDSIKIYKFDEDLLLCVEHFDSDDPCSRTVRTGKTRVKYSFEVANNKVASVMMSKDPCKIKRMWISSDDIDSGRVDLSILSEAMREQAIAHAKAANCKNLHFRTGSVNKRLPLFNVGDMTCSEDWCRWNLKI